MNEYIFVHLIEKEPVGSNLGKTIPLHMTALHWFEVDRTADEVNQQAKLALRGLLRLATIAEDEDMFDPDEDVPVMRLVRTPELLDLHLRLLKSMRGLGATFDNRWVGPENWSPHVTHKAESKLSPNDPVIVDDIDLISRVDKNADRIILNRIDLTQSF
jgi:hypothetical protein